MNNKENVPKRTHIVQQAYLKNFSRKTNKGFFLYRFDKQTEKVQYLNVKKVAVEKYFYPPEVENWLANEIEINGITVINKIIEKESIEFLNNTKKIDLTRWILVQDCRTREYRIEVKQGIEAMTKRLLEIDFIPKKVPELLKKKYSIEYDEGPVRDLQMSMLLRFEKLAPKIANYHWYLCVNDTKLPYYTSDHPIIKHNPYFSSVHKITGKKALGSGIGYLVGGIHLAVPLSPRLLLEIGDLSPILENPVAQLLLKGHTISKRNLEKNNVEFYNENIIWFSNKYIFSHNNDFTNVHNFLKLNPELKDKKKERFKIM